MADPTTFPDDENLQSLKDFRDVQKEIYEHILKQKKIYEDIGRINKDIEQDVMARSQNETKMLETIRQKTVEYYRQVEHGILIKSDAERKAHIENLANIKREIDDTRTQLSLSREISAIEIAMAKRQHEEGTKWFNFVKNKGKEIFDIDSKTLATTKNIGEEFIRIGVKSEAFAFTLGAVFTILKGSVELFKKMDDAAFEFRKTLGLTRTDAQFIRRDAENTAIQFMSMGVTIDSVYKSYEAIGKAVGGIHNVTAATARDVALMSAQLGISEDVSAAFMRNLAAVSKSSLESQTNMLGLAQSLSSAAGVPLGEIMKDVGSRSEQTLTMMSRLPNVALRSAIELRRMGTSLEASAKSSRHILDFFENINEEMEASVLLGRSINLQRARELAYRRDITGSTKEILRITKSINFSNLDPFQQEAFARATGKSVDELLKMLQTDKQLEQIRRSGTSEQKAELALYEKMRSENDAAAKARGQSAMDMIRTLANQQRLVQIQNKWNELLAKAQQFLLPIIDTILSGVLALMDWAPAIMAFLKPLGSSLEMLGEWIAGGTKVVGWIASAAARLAVMGGFIGKIGVFIESLGSKIFGVFKFFGTTLGFLGKFLGFFGKFLGPIGWVIMAFQAIGGFIKGWNSTTGNWLQKLGGGVMGALRGIIPGFDYIVKAVKWVAGWVEKIGKAYFGFWLSALGYAYNHLKSIGTMIISLGKLIFNWLVAPFERIGHFIGGLYSKITGKSVEAKAAAAYVPAVTVTPNGTKIETPTARAAAVKKEEKPTSAVMSEETGQRMVALLEKIHNKDTTIKMDGQLLSTTLARQTEFRGGYGVNKVA